MRINGDHIFIGYILGFFLTFGHAFYEVPAGYESWGGHFIQYGVFERSFGAIIASVAWPLYWSTQAHKAAR